MYYIWISLNAERIMHLIKLIRKALGFGKLKTTALIEKGQTGNLSARVLLVWPFFLLSFTFIGLSIILSEEI